MTYIQNELMEEIRLNANIAKLAAWLNPTQVRLDYTADYLASPLIARG